MRALKSLAIAYVLTENFLNRSGIYNYRVLLSENKMAEQAATGK